MFSKAKLKRFNEESSCTPSPAQYDPKFKNDASAAITLDKSDRWKASKEVVPGPGAYTGPLVKSPIRQRTSTSSSKLNSSTCSTASTASSCGNFVSPQKPPPLARSLSMKVMRKAPGDKDVRINELENKISELTEERDGLKSLVYHLEKQLEELKEMINKSDMDSEVKACERVKYEAELKSANIALNDKESQMESLNITISMLTQQNEQLRSQIDSGGKLVESEIQQQLQNSKMEIKEVQQYISALNDERSGLLIKIKELEESSEQKSISEDELQNLKEQLEHLILLRDNLEAAVRSKDDLIAELQVQLDEMVIEGRTYQEQFILYRSKVEHLEEEIQNTFAEREDAENKVRSLVAKYESLIKDQVEEREINREILAKKDIEIELLNASLSNLNMKASEYEQTIISLEEEKQDRLSKISVLETTISELSMKTKEKEMMESILDEELNHRTDEVSVLEEKIKEFERKLKDIQDERDILGANLEAEKKIPEELNKKISVLEMEIKEKEVVQQFLEKEITAREGEISASAQKIKDLEENLEMARLGALDLQQEEETKMNELKALDEEVTSVKAALKSKEEILESVESKLVQFEDNNRQLEEKVLELMGEISDREAEHIVRMKSVESDLEDMGVKYSDSLLEHEAARRVLSQTLEQLDRERLVRMASEGDLNSLKEEFKKCKEEKEEVEANMKDLVQKYTTLEDALACEEAENRDLEERLESEIKQAKEAALSAEKEILSLKTSSDGFCTQITQLKIDMKKKSQAVKEMQQCIEGLREEKLHLVTLRDNLEKTVETKEENLAMLQLQISNTEREMEEERVTLRSRIGDLENHLKEAENEQKTNTEKVRSLEDKITSLEQENLGLNQSYEKQLEEKTLSETQANSKLEEMTKQYEGYEDQLKNLQTSLREKIQELEDVHEKFGSSNKVTVSLEEEVKVLQTSVKRFQREIDAMNKTIASKDASLNTLNITLGTKSEEVQSLYKKLEEKQSFLLASEAKVQQLEENEEKLIKERDELTISFSNLQQDLSLSKSQYSRLESTFMEEKSAEISRVTSALELDFEEQKKLNSSLQEELDIWKSKVEHLERMIEPFREQLDAFEIEKAGLLSRSSAAKEEVDRLSRQYATLLGHQNHKQKIQHVLKLKTENNELKEDMYKLRQETERQRKTIRRLEEKINKTSGSTSCLNEVTRSNVDKENSVYVGTGNISSSTPLKASNKPNRI